MREKTIVSSTILDLEVHHMMDSYLEESGEKKLVFLDKALDFYERIGRDFELYDIHEPKKKSLRLYESTLNKIQMISEKTGVDMNIIWNTAIKDYVLFRTS